MTPETVADIFNKAGCAPPVGAEENQRFKTACHNIAVTAEKERFTPDTEELGLTVEEMFQSLNCRSVTIERVSQSTDTQGRIKVSLPSLDMGRIGRLFYADSVIEAIGKARDWLIWLNNEPK